MSLLSKHIFNDEKPGGWLPWAALAPLLGFIFVVVSAIIGQLVLEFAGLVDQNGSPDGTYALLLFLVLPFSLMLLTIWLWVRQVEKRSLASIGFTGARPTRTFIIGHLIGIGTITLVVLAVWLAGGYEARAYLQAFGSLGALVGIVALLAGFALQASVEEIVFRGWLLSAMTRKSNLLIAMIGNSALFALLHLDPDAHWINIINVFLFGLFASAWVIRTGNIWGAMGWHAGWNWLLAVGYDLPITGLDAGVPALLVSMEQTGDILLTGGPVGPEGSYMCTAFFVIATILLLVGRKQA